MRVDVKKLIQELVVPEIRQVLAEVQTMRVEIKRLDDKIENGLARLDGKIETGLTRLDEKVETGLARLDEKIETGLARLDEKVDLVRSELKAEMDSLRKEVDSLRKEMDSFRKEVETRFAALSGRIDVALDLRERISRLEARVESLTGKPLS